MHGVPSGQEDPGDGRALQPLDRLRHRQGGARARAPSSRSPTRTSASRIASWRWRASSARSSCCSARSASDAEIECSFRRTWQAHWDGLDGLVHAIAFAPREAIAGRASSTGCRARRSASRTTSRAYSFSGAGQSRAAHDGGPQRLAGDADLPRRRARGAATTTPWASPRRASRPRCATSRPTSARSGIRVNGISAGPIKTLAAAGIAGFGKILKFVEEHAPLRRNVTIDEVGNVAAFLLSDLAAAVTGEILYVDSGFSQVVGGMAVATSSPDSTG